LQIPNNYSTFVAVLVEICKGTIIVFIINWV
jgi:hypothetical protein